MNKIKISSNLVLIMCMITITLTGIYLGIRLNVYEIIAWSLFGLSILIGTIVSERVKDVK